MSLLVDARPIFGDPSLPAPSRVFREFTNHPATVELLLQDSLSRRDRTGRIRDRVAGRSDGFDVKGRGLLPVVNIARWVALGVGSSERQTVHRLRSAGGSPLLRGRDADRLSEAFEVLQFDPAGAPT
ncbi:putative nucleotidyltransferase substrate binding domain-containing protein [Gordonia malaquae]|uniref:putative nucleotidyltransferase substrate binding domain-containing protein n=1 Tax=Gordonia malaquae TaxID=410332 RepID=UPI0030FE85C2